MVASCDFIYMTFWKDKTIEIKSGSVVAKGWVLVLWMRQRGLFCRAVKPFFEIRHCGHRTLCIYQTTWNFRAQRGNLNACKLKKFN